MARRGAIINTVGRDLNNYRKGKIRRIKKLVIDSVTKIEYLANRSLVANSNAEFNLNFINVDKKFEADGLKGEVGVMGDNEMAAYIEFGTGLSAKDILSKYPQWVRDIAMQFFKTGEGMLQGKPYLYNNYLTVLAEFKRELDLIVKN